MDIDIDDYESQIAAAASRQTASIRREHPVDDNHPFDLEAYISNYTGAQTSLKFVGTLITRHVVITGRTAVDRLVHIMTEIPALAPQALRAAPAFIRKMKDPNLYDAVIAAYESVRASQAEKQPPGNEIIEVDQRWVEDVRAGNNKERQKLEAELKTYSTNMIKESIRVRSMFSPILYSR
jgi:COP9 signalosome complex subunit 1